MCLSFAGKRGNNWRKGGFKDNKRGKGNDGKAQSGGGGGRSDGWPRKIPLILFDCNVSKNIAHGGSCKNEKPWDLVYSEMVGMPSQNMP